MTILIDADGCPVVDVTIKIAKENKARCLILCDTSHIFERDGAETLTVSKGADSVDFALVNMVEAGDIVITQDYGYVDNSMNWIYCQITVSAETMIPKESLMTILIDADGCPVVDVTIKIAKENKARCIILCDTSHIFERDGAETLTVSKGADSVDFALVNMVEAGDIVITQDYGLAAMCLARRAVPISQDGMVYSADNIDALLLQRHTAKKIRMSGGRLRGSPKRTSEQDLAFERRLKEFF